MYEYKHVFRCREIYGYEFRKHVFLNFEAYASKSEMLPE